MPLTVNGIQIGTWSLVYNQRTGIMDYAVQFNSYAGFFDAASIIAGASGSGSFVAEVNGGNVSTNGMQSAGSITVVRPEVPEKPSVPSVPEGIGWAPSAPDAGNSITTPFGKGVKWSSPENSEQAPCFEWRVVYLDDLLKKQEPFASADEADEYGKNLSVDPISGNTIFTDTLDANQKFGGLEDGQKYNSGAPFYLEIPIMLPDTSQVINRSGWHGNVDGPGDINNNVITGEKLLKITAENYAEHLPSNVDTNLPEYEKIIAAVEHTPLSWAVTTNTNTRCQTLTINVGKLGTKAPHEAGDASAEGINLSMTQSYEGNKDWAGVTSTGELKAVQTLQRLIDEAQQNATPVGYGKTSSPFVKLVKAYNEVCNWFPMKVQRPSEFPGVSFSGNSFEKNGSSKEQVDAAVEAFKTFTTAFNEWEASAEASVENGYASLEIPAELMDAYSNFYAKMSILRIDSGATAATRNDVANLNKGMNTFAAAQTTYAQNLASYLTAWQSYANSLMRAYNFYDEGQILGFNVKVATTVTNTSVTTFTNEAGIKSGESEYTANDSAEKKFNNFAQGAFSVGSIVVQKAESIWTDNDPNNDSENIADAAQAGLAGAEFQMYCDDTSNNVPPTLDAAHRVWFMDKQTSSNKNTYAYIHRGGNHSVSGHPNLGDDSQMETDVLATNNEGIFAVANLQNGHEHWLVETKAPAGFYLDQTPVKVQGSDTAVVYRQVANVARAVQLKKVSAYNGKPVSGAEFALFKKGAVGEGDVQISSFTKQQRTVNGKTTYYYVAGTGSEALLTDAHGELNIHGLEAGTYYLKEVKPAAGYEQADDQAAYEFVLSKELPQNAQLDEFGFYRVAVDAKPSTPEHDAVENIPLNAENGITVSKVNKDNEALAGALFALFEWTGTEEQFQANRDDMSLWKPAQLQQEGSSSVDAFLSTPNEVTKDYVVGTAVNQLINGKTLDAVASDAQGVIALHNIPLGHYRMIEVKAAQGFVRNNIAYRFDVVSKADGTDVEVSKLYTFENGQLEETSNNTIVNFRMPARLGLLKYDAQKDATSNTLQGAPVKPAQGATWNEAEDGWLYEGVTTIVRADRGLAGAVYKVYEQDGAKPNPASDQCIGEGVTNADGILEMPSTLQENDALPQGGTAGKIKFNEGVLVEVEPVAGTKVVGLHPDTYYLVETSAPEGFLLDATPIVYDLNRHTVPPATPGMTTPGIIKRVSNTPYEYAIHVVKTDAHDGAPLAGAKFVLDEVQPDGGLARMKFEGVAGDYEAAAPGLTEEVLTNAQGALVLGGLKNQTEYVLTEIAAPAGYQLPAKEEDRQTHFFVSRDASQMKPGQVLEQEGHYWGVHTNVSNDRIPAKAQLVKVDAHDGTPLAGVTFELYRVEPQDNGATVDRYVGEATTNDQGVVVFEGLNAWGADYFVQEVAAPAGYMPSIAKYEFNLGNKPGVTIQINEGKPIENTFAATGSTTLAAKKIFDTNGHDGIELEEGMFQFKLEQLKIDAKGQDALANNGSRVIVAGLGNAAPQAESNEAVVLFPELSYSIESLLQDVADGYAREQKDPQTGLRTWTLRYRALEQTDNLPEGVTATKSAFDFRVIVSDKGDGTLAAQVIYPEGFEGSNGEEAGLVFRNAYDKAVIDISGAKVLSVPEGLAGTNIAGKYTFELVAKDSAAPMPEGSLDGRKTVLNDESGNVDFGTIVYTANDLDDAETADDGSKTKEFEYAVTEHGEYAGITNDKVSTKNITVTVTLSEDGKISAAKSMAPGYDVAFRFVNSYSAEPVAVKLGANKALVGADLTQGVFEFELKALTPGAPMPEGAKDGVITASNAALDASDMGAVDFGSITFTKRGVYRYQIAEKPGSEVDMSYDTTVHTVVVEVTDDHEGKLLARVSYDGKTGDAAAELPVFTNIYVAPASSEITIGKKVVGGGTQAGQHFSFVCKPEDEFTKQALVEGVLESPALTEDSQYTEVKTIVDSIAQNEMTSVVFSKLTIHKEGVYRFTIAEDCTQVPDGWTYDAAVRHVAIEVTRDSNKLVASEPYIADHVSSTFVNVFETPEVPDPDNPGGGEETPDPDNPGGGEETPNPEKPGGNESGTPEEKPGVAKPKPGVKPEQTLPGTGDTSLMAPSILGALALSCFALALHLRRRNMRA